MVEPGFGTAVGGIVFAIGGGIAGYWAGEKAGSDIYDWAEGTVFMPLQEFSVASDDWQSAMPP